MPVFSKAYEKAWSGEIDWTSDDFELSLIDLSDGLGLAVTGATNATPIVVTSTGHGLSNGARVAIAGILGNTAANGEFVVASATTDTFALQTTNGVNVAGNGSYTSGGYIVPLDEIEFADELTGVVATEAMSGEAFLSGGRLDAGDVVFSALTGDPVDAIVITKDTGSAATSPVIYIGMRAASGSIIAFTPGGGSCTVTWPASGIFGLRR